MSRTLTESQFQNWRAIAVGQPGTERLLCLGRSFQQIYENYLEAFKSVLAPDEQEETCTIIAERWHGVADRGHWTTRKVLPRPPRQSLRSMAG